MPKFSSGAQAESLASLQGSELLANGCVNLIGLDAIRDRAGDLWPRKRELVWEFTEKHLQERLAPHDLMLRVDDTTYLVAIVADYATAAQAVCVRALEEVLLHFIGHLDRADIRLQRVTTIDGTEIAASDVDLARVPRLEDVARRAADISPSPQREREKNPVLFRSVSGRRLRIDFTPSPVTSLRHGVLTALHLSRTVVDEETEHRLSFEELDGLTDADLIRIDAATMDYAGLFTRQDALADQLLAASEATGEGLWRLPLHPTYAADLRSPVADLKHTGVTGAGAGVGAHFIGEFVNPDTPWAHLDIAGVDSPDGMSAGYGVRLLERFVLDWQPVAAE